MTTKNTIKRFEDLEVWQKGMNVAVEVYKLTSDQKFSKEYSIKDQIIRAAISISNNISEGFEYDNNKDFIKFLRYAKGSAGEVRNLLHFLLRVNLINKEYFEKHSNELTVLSKQLFSFIKYLKENTQRI